MALKGVSMEKDLNSQYLYVPGNRFELEQLFENLILNSIYSMDGRLLGMPYIEKLVIKSA